MTNSKDGLEDFLIEETSKTPRIEFKEGILNIKGVSIPKDASEFYKPLLEYLDKYKENPATSTEINVNLDYFNISSGKFILDIFKKFEPIHKSRREVVINWYYKEDDEDMLEAGEDYESIIRIPFKMKEIIN